jgi:hypothetical protein
MKKFREFRDYPPEQVQEVAQMLYARAPFDVHTSEKTRWNLLLQQAFEFLDKLHEAREEIAERRRKQGERYAAVNVRLAEADKLSDFVPLEKAARWITRETHTARALPKLKKVLRFQAQHAGYGKAWIENKLDKRLNDWRKTGIPRAEVVGLRGDFERLWPEIVAEQNRAKKAKLI